MSASRPDHSARGPWCECAGTWLARIRAAMMPRGELRGTFSLVKFVAAERGRQRVERSTVSTVQMSTLEFPDPVVASFLSRVRSIPAESDEPTWADRRRAVMQVDGSMRRAIGLTLLAMHAATVSFVSASSVWFVRPTRARLAYRSLFRDLRQAGWGVEHCATIAQALFAIRHRTVGEMAIRLYERTMQSRIPRQSLGWS